MIKVAIIDDNPAVIFGITAAFEKTDEIELVFSCSLASEFLLKLESHAVDVLVVDIVLEDVIGLNFLSELREKYPNKFIIAYSNAEGQSIELYLESVGIEHLISKKVSTQVLIDCIINGESNAFKSIEMKNDDTVVLTQREFQILSQLGKGFSSTDIGDILNISANTVNFHKKKLLRKFKVNSIAEMMRDAADLGMFRS